MPVICEFELEGEAVFENLEDEEQGYEIVRNLLSDAIRTGNCPDEIDAAMNIVCYKVSEEELKELFEDY